MSLDTVVPSASAILKRVLSEGQKKQFGASSCETYPEDNSQILPRAANSEAVAQCAKHTLVVQGFLICGCSIEVVLTETLFFVLLRNFFVGTRICQRHIRRSAWEYEPNRTYA